MNVCRRLATAVIAGGVLAGGVATAAPANAFAGTRFVNAYSLRCLDSNTNGGGWGQTYLSDCGPSDNPYQHWWWTNPKSVNGAVYGQWRNSATGLCLDGNASGDVYTSTCGTGNDYQYWVTLPGNYGGEAYQSLGTRRFLQGYAVGPGSVRTTATEVGSSADWGM